MEKIKLTAETFDSVMAMLQSSDKESIVLGLSCIEEIDIETGLVYLLLMKKLANIMPEVWREHAPKKYLYLKSMDVPVDAVITYKKILDIVKERKVPVNDIQFLLNKFAIYLTEGLIMDYPGLDNIEINLKLKLHVTEIS